MSKFHKATLPGVIVSAGKTANTLGVVRCFGRRGIPVTLVETILDSPARYSRYVNGRLRPDASENLANTLIDLLRAVGEQADRKRVIIPTGDEEVVALARAREELSPYYLFSLARPEVIESLTDKSRFYRFLEQQGYPHPRTVYPADLDELLRLGREFPLPFLIKPAESLSFQDRYMRKCFQVTSIQELDRAADQLGGSNLRVMIQEIIPGDQFYEFYVYLDRTGQPKGICGWDRLRQYPPNFGNGTLCRARFCSEAIELGLETLSRVGFSGLGAVELKMDPRDQQYKIIEINPRTTLQNRLAAACGVDMEYLAYLDLTGQPVASVGVPDTGTVWVDDFTDLFSASVSFIRGQSTGRKLSKRSNQRKIRSIAALDDPIPLLARSCFLAKNAWRSWF